MSLIDRARSEYAMWIASVAEAVVAVRGRYSRQPVVRLTETAASGFVMHAITLPKQATLPEVRFDLGETGEVPPLPEAWRAAVRGARIEVELRTARFLERPLELPGRAAEFLDAMIRSQLDRLTPWSATDAVFSWTPAVDIGSDRIKVDVIAAPKAKLDPLVQLAEDWGAGSLVLNTRASGSPAEAAPVRVLERRFDGGLDVDRVRGIVGGVLLGTAGVAAVAFVLGDLVGGRLEAEQQQLAARIAERRAALRLGAATTGDGAPSELVRRKRTTPSTVMALDALSSSLPDNTYVTELRFEKDKVQIVGITQDAPSLVKLLEQSPMFSRATFFAPTTHAANDPGERFHVEARLRPSFGPQP